MGHWSIAGNGISPAKMARDSFRNIAERLLDGIFTGRGCGAICPANVGLAADVLDRRAPGAAGILYIRSCTGIRSVEAASRSLDGRGAQNRRKPVEEFSLSGFTDD